MALRAGAEQSHGVEDDDQDRHLVHEHPGGHGHPAEQDPEQKQRHRGQGDPEDLATGYQCYLRPNRLFHLT